MFKLKSVRYNRVLWINAIYSFLAAAMAVLVPLYLIEKDVEIEQIGLLLALSPLVFAFLRITLAAVADIVGTRTIGIVYSVAGIVSTGLYILSNSVAGLAFAICGESIRGSGFWAINRTEIIYESEDPKAALAVLSGVRQFADGFGRLFIGFVLVFLAFQNSFLLLGVLSLALLYLAVKSKQEKRPIPVIDLKQKIIELISKPRPKTFWEASLLLSLGNLTANMLLAFVIPVYAKAELGMDYGQIGSLVAIFSFVDAAVVFLCMRWKINVNLLPMFTALTIPALIMVPFFGQDLAIPVVIAAIGTGCSGILFEYMLLDQMYRSKHVSTDIGMLNTPPNLLVMILTGTGGYMIRWFGYQSLFLVLGIASLLFVIFGRAFIRDRR